MYMSTIFVERHGHNRCYAIETIHFLVGPFAIKGLYGHPSRRSELNLCGGVVHRYQLNIHSFYVIINDFPLLEGFGIIFYLCR